MKSVNAWHSRKWNYWAHRQPEWLVTSQREPRLVSGFTSELKLKRDVRAADHGWLPDEIFSRVDRLTTLCHDLPAFGWWAVWGSLATAWALLFCLHHLKKKKENLPMTVFPFEQGSPNSMIPRPLIPCQMYYPIHVCFHQGFTWLLLLSVF